MPSKISIKERITHAQSRRENTLNLSFPLREVQGMMDLLGVKETEGTDVLSKKIVEKISKD